MNIAILYRTHTWNNQTSTIFNDILQSSPAYDTFIAYNSDTCKSIPPHTHTYAYNSDIFIQRKWKTGHRYKDTALMWFRCDVPIVNFLITHPQYDFAWTIDYDVTYDNWSHFFNYTTPQLHNIDFLSTNNLTPETDPQWEWWPYHTTTNMKLFAGYFPLVGFSQRACQLLNILYQIHAGYCEIIVPTLLNHNQLICKNIKEIYPYITRIQHKYINEFY